MENTERNADDRIQWDRLYPQILKHINIDEMWVSGTPNNYEELIQDREFLEVIKMNIFMRKFMHSLYNNIRNDVSILIEQVDNHIQYLKK